MKNYTKLAVSAFGLAVAAVSSVQAENRTPEPGSPRALGQARFEQWMNMAGGSCCSTKDFVYGLRSEEQPDNAEFPYRVLFTATVEGVPLSEPVWVPIPANKVKKNEDLDELCKPVVDADNANKVKSTCVHPPGAVLFAYDNVVLQSDGTYAIYANSLKLNPGDKMPKELYKVTDKWCFYPPKPTN